MTMSDQTKGAANAKAEFITPPKTLQNKVDKGGPGAVDLGALAKAEAVIDNLAGDYLDWVSEDFIRLEVAFVALKSGAEDDKKNIDAMFSIVHDMKGQGGSFGFPLMTQICDLLSGILENGVTFGPRDHRAMRVYIDAMRVVITHKLKGDGGKEGSQLLMGLQLMRQKG
ncbi:MAG: phosphorelay protein [Rhodospirillaceae bacterium]|nr:MAG: phosphorelay protein [Rhodospirillaceae bacterium]